MEQNEPRDWKNVISKQIAVYKTDKKLLELNDSLKPASKLFPAHIHAMGEESEDGARSLIRLNMLDYSKGKGEHTVSVYANINPEETKYIYSRNFIGVAYFEFIQEKIFGIPDQDGLSIVTKLSIKRYEKDSQGQKRRYPWMIEIQNGRGKAIKNPNGGKYCGKDTYICDAAVSISINDLDMFSLFSKADAYLGAFEQEYAFRYNLLGNFNKLYCLLKNEMGNQIGEALKSLEKAEEAEDEKMAS